MTNILQGTEAPTTASLLLHPMTHLAEAKCTEDDWSGISNRSVRKKRQNRLNQRAYRRRKAGHMQSSSCGMSTTNLRPSTLYDHHSNPHYGINYTATEYPPISEIEYDVLQQSPLRVENVKTSSRGDQMQQTAFIIGPEYQSQSDTPWPPNAQDLPLKTNREQLSGPLIVQVASRTIQFNHHQYFPLPSDHLLTLIRYNLFRAVAANSWSLGIDPILMHSDILSPFTSEWPETPPSYLSMPPTLFPTALQMCTPHHPYIDLFPFPQLRDNLLQIGEEIDEDMLCADFAGDNKDSADLCEHTGLIVWGEPWDPFSWEISESLLLKWSGLFKNCSELLDATNGWRERRGEPRLTEIL